MKLLNFLFVILFTCWVIPAYAIIDIVGMRYCSGPGVCDGQITVAATGSAGPFTFLWSNGSTTSTVSNLCAGPYSVTVTNRIGCPVVLSTYVNTCQATSNNYISITGTVHNATQPTDLAVVGVLANYQVNFRLLVVGEDASYGQ